MQKKKVMHILNSDTFGGAENIVISLINGLKNDVRGIYVSREGTTIREALEENGIEYLFLRDMKPVEIRRVVREVKPEIIHAHDFTAGVLTVLANVKVPILNHLHGTPPWIKTFGFKSIVYALTYKWYYRVICVSSTVMDEYVFGNYFKKKTLTIGNPINVAEIVEKSNQPSDFKQQYDIAYLGRISLPKNPLLFLKIVYQVCKKYPDLKVVMIGDGDLRSEVEANIEELDLGDIIDVLGYQNNPYPILKNAKLLCMTSSSEGCPLAVMEALALRKPVVCSGVGSLKDIVTKDVGLICTSIEDYVDEIEKLLKDEAYFKAKSENAGKRALEMDDISTYCRRMKALYIESLKETDK